MNSSTLSKELLSDFILWLPPAFWSRDMTMYLVLSAFTFSPISLPAIIKASTFSFIICTLPSYILTSAALTRSSCVPFNFKPSWLAWTLLITYSKAKLKSNNDKASPCFKPFLIGTCQTNSCLPRLCYTRTFQLDTFLFFMFLWPYIVSKAWRKNTKKIQQYRWIIVNFRCWLLTTVSTCFGHLYAHHQEKRPRVTAYGVYLL